MRRGVFRHGGKLGIWLVAVVACFATLAPSAGLAACAAPRKKAIVMVPGLLAGSLVDSETGEPVWDPFKDNEYTLADFFDPKVRPKMIGHLLRPGIEILTKIINDDPDSMLHALTLNEDGENERPNIVPTDFDAFPGEQRYGALQSFRLAHDALKERYPDTEIKVFNCDWRIDNRTSAERLEKFIEGNGYTDVVLVGHSMGNLVNALYLARSEKNRKKVVANLSLAGPYYGSVKALAFLEGFEDMMSGLDSTVNGMLPSALSAIEIPIGKIVDTQIRPLAMNLATLPQLLPSAELLEAPQYAEGESFAIFEGKALRDAGEISEFYSSRPWSKRKSDGKVKKFVREFMEYRDAFYAKRKGKRAHATRLVPTYYIAGLGVPTQISCVSDGERMIDEKICGDGDGTVPFYSATLGQEGGEESDFRPGAKIRRNSSFVGTIEGADHFDCGVYFDEPLRTKVFAFLDAVHRLRRFSYANE